jgi:hypothetical protein
MTCSYCEIHNGGFSSEKAYVEFEEVLFEALRFKHLHEIGKPPDGGPFRRRRYVCNKCGRHWQLTAPDQAFRGDWSEIVPNSVGRIDIVVQQL